MGDVDEEFRCFVGGLSWDTDERGLFDAFQKYGVADSKVIQDRDTGRSRGFGFVTFKDKASMDDAIEGMNGQDLDGRQITVNMAQPRGGGGGRSFGGSGGGGGGGGAPGGGDCFKCNQPGHWARECPSAGGGGGYSRGGDRGGGDRYGGGGSRGGSDRYGGGSDRYSSGGGRGGDRYGDRYSNGGGSGSRYESGGGGRDRSGPYDRPSRSSHDDRY